MNFNPDSFEPYRVGSTTAHTCTAFSGVFALHRRDLRRLPKSSRCQTRSPFAVEARADKTSGNEGMSSDSVESQWNTGKVRAARQMRGGGKAGRGTVRIQGKYYRTATLPPQPPGLRVTAGSARGRRVKSPNVYLRPMMGKVREALFSMLDMFEVMRSDGSTLDLFAGSGSVGIESLSRGMGTAVFVDASQECTDTIAENLASCQFTPRGQTVCARVENFLEHGIKYNNDRHYDLITLTPPYEEVEYSTLMMAVARSECVGEGTFVVVEYPVELKCLPPAIGQRLVGIRNRRYGRTVLALYACQPGTDVDARPGEFVDVTRK